MATLTINLNNVQPLDSILTELSELSLSGNALKYIRVNATADGFELETVSGGGMTIGEAVTGATANRVLYVDGSGNLANAAGLQFNGTELGVGGAAVSGRKAQIVGTGVTDKLVVLKSVAAQTGNHFESRHSDDTIQSKMRFNGNWVLGGDFNELGGNNNTLLSLYPSAGQGINAIAISDGTYYDIFRRGHYYSDYVIRISSYQTSPYTQLLIGQNGVSIGKDGVSAASASLHVYGRAHNQVTMKVQAIASQTANLHDWNNSSGTALSSIDILGAFHPPNISVLANAQNNSIFESGGFLYYKDSSGTAHLLY